MSFNDFFEILAYLRGETHAIKESSARKIWQSVTEKCKLYWNFAEMIEFLHNQSHKKRKKTYLKILPGKKFNFSTTSGQKNAKFDAFL